MVFGVSRWGHIYICMYAQAGLGLVCSHLNGEKARNEFVAAAVRKCIKLPWSPMKRSQFIDKYERVTCNVRLI